MSGGRIRTEEVLMFLGARGRASFLEHLRAEGLFESEELDPGPNTWSALQPRDRTLRRRRARPSVADARVAKARMISTICRLTRMLASHDDC